MIVLFVFCRTVLEDLGPHEYVMGLTLVDEGLDEDTSEQENLDARIFLLSASDISLLHLPLNFEE